MTENVKKRSSITLIPNQHKKDINLSHKNWKIINKKNKLNLVTYQKTNWNILERGRMTKKYILLHGNLFRWQKVNKVTTV